MTFVRMKKFRRLGSLPGGHPLRAVRFSVWGPPDVGQAVLEDGRLVFTTWGLNLPRELAEKIAQRTGWEVVENFYANPKVYELVIPDQKVRSALGQIARMPSDWVYHERWPVGVDEQGQVRWFHWAEA